MAKPGAQILMRRVTDEVDLGCSVCGPPDAGAAPRYGPPVAGSDWAALFAGDVVVEAVKRPDGSWLAGLVCGCSTARAHLGLLDYANFPKIFPDIHDMRAHARSAGRPGRVLGECCGVKIPHMLYRHYDEPGRRLTWTRVAGDLKRIEGSWEIHDTPRSDVQMLVYESYIDVGSVVLRLVRLEAMRKAREMGERLRNWIEGRPMPE